MFRAGWNIHLCEQGSRWEMCFLPFNFSNAKQCAKVKGSDIALYNNLVKMEDVCCRAFKRDCEIRGVIGSLES